MTRKTFDEIAFEQLLQTGRVSPALVKLSRQASGELCPECGSTETEDNGSREFRCCSCDHRWGFEYGEQYGF